MTIMKKRLLLRLISLSILLISCDDLLNVTPGSDLTDSGFWKSETDLKAACNRMYQQLSSGGHDTRADDQFGRSGTNNISNSQRTLQDADESDWKDPYDRIYLANNIIEKAADAKIAESIRDRYIGEAMFFRAWYHFDLVKKYGDVPLVTKIFESGNDPDLKMPRTPREDVIRQCYEDLEFAAAHLPTRAAWTTTDEFDRRRVTRSSALGLIVRIGLYEGTFQKYHAGKAYNTQGGDSKAHLKKSIDAFELLKKEGHELFTTGGPEKAYQDMFGEEDQTKNKEIIFARAHGPNGMTGSGTSNISYTNDTEGNYAVSRKMIDLYLYADGLPIEKTALRVEEESSHNNIVGLETDCTTPLPGGKGARDPRLKLSIWLHNDPQGMDDIYGWSWVGKGDYRPLNTMQALGYHLKKRFFRKCYGPSADYTDVQLIRYGEMLISYAEALYEYNGSITDVQLDETVNALRARAGFDKKLTNAFVNSNGLDMLTEIRRERTVELMAENLRYSDLIRWKTAETELPKAILGAHYSPTEVPDFGSEYAARLTNSEGKSQGETVMTGVAIQKDIYVFELPGRRTFHPERDYLYPIPPYEIVHSDGNVIQNPGWDE
jgi:hypothetical protein